MIHLDGHKSNNIFCRRVYPCSRFQGQGYYTFQMEDFRRRQYLPGSSQPKWLHNSLSSKDDRAIGGEGFRGQPERPQSTVAFDVIIFKGRLIRLRQAGKDKFKRQAIGACGDRGKAVLVGKLTSFAIWAENRREAEEAQDDEKDIFDAMKSWGYDAVLDG